MSLKIEQLIRHTVLLIYYVSIVQKNQESENFFFIAPEISCLIRSAPFGVLLGRVVQFILGILSQSEDSVAVGFTVSCLPQVLLDVNRRRHLENFV